MYKGWEACEEVGGPERTSKQKPTGAPGLNQDLLRTGGENPEGKGIQAQTGVSSIPRGTSANTPDLIMCRAVFPKSGAAKRTCRLNLAHCLFL